MSLELVIREICKNLVSNRANERKKAAESLKKYFETGKAVPSMLSQNTLNKTGYNWNHVFDDIHAYIIKETEKFETSKTFQTATVPLCTSLLQLCVKNANYGRAYIKCEKLTDACLHILVDSRLATAIGDAYLSLLYKYILPHENYLIYISPSTWDDLLGVCMSACLSKTSLDSVMKLKLVSLVIKNATSYCQFVIPLRSHLCKLKEYFVKCTSNKKIHEIEIMTLILETLSTECRLTICEFIEAVLPSIFKSYDQNFDQKTKQTLFKLLEVAIMLHHPEGRAQGTPGSLAHNWHVWNKHLDSILEIVCSEIAFKQKQMDYTNQQCQNFSYVAAAVMHQVFQSSKLDIEEVCASSSKKQKVTSNNNKCFKDLTDQLNINSMPWIGITHAYVKNYGSNVTVSEYFSLLKVLEKVLTDNRKTNTHDYQELACLTINKLSKCLKVRDHTDFIISFWSCCVRNSVTVEPLQKAVHAILFDILNLRVLNYQHIEPLFAMYLEERMPVNDKSLSTLICIFKNFYGECSCSKIKLKCLKWLLNGKNTDLDPLNVKEILLNLVTNVNVTLKATENKICGQNDLYDILFTTIDRSILFSEFECRQPQVSVAKEFVQDKVEISTIVAKEINNQMEKMLSEYMTKTRTKDVTPLEFSKILQLIIHYFDILLTYTTMPLPDIEKITLYGVLNNALRQMYEALKDKLKDNTSIRHKIKLLQSVQAMLHVNYHTMLNNKIRETIDKDCFICINEVLRSELVDDGEAMYEEDDMEMSMKTLKHNCILFLAEYCRQRTCHTNEILRCILDSDLYDLKLNSDVDTAFRCIELLNELEVDKPSLELTFTLMLDICQALFRNPKVTHRLLELLLEMIDHIWIHANDETKSNIGIMIKSYLQRCTKDFYPPHTAALVYECAAKMVKLSSNQAFQQEKRTLFRNVNGPVHSIRIFSCYLLKRIGDTIFENDIQEYMEQLAEIFVTDVPSTNESILADESANRTSTLLHGYYGLALAKQCLVHDVVMKIVELQTEKTLDKHMVKKVLNLLSNEIASCPIETYLTSEIVNILYYWFVINKHFYDFPVFLFGYDKELFMEKHVRWLAAADVLWYKKGEAKNSLYLNRVADNRNTSVENIVEMCFCNMIALCLPYIVCDKYNIPIGRIKSNISGNNANRMLQFTRMLLKDDKWNDLFVANIGELVLMSATNLCDVDDVQKEYGVNIPQRKHTFTYNKEVFIAILKYFSEILDGNVIQILCTNQPLAVLHILNKLCGNVFKEKVFELRILSLHTYLTVVDAIPLGCPSDSILCNFACVSPLHAIQDTGVTEEIKILVKSFENVLTKILSHRVHIEKAVVSKAFSILTTKKEAGFLEECESLLTYLTENVRVYSKDGDDVVDFISAMSQGKAEGDLSVNKRDFKDKLESYILGLIHTSIETLLNLRSFLRTNLHFVNTLCEELSVKGFSEDCETSVIHKVIFALSNIIKTTYDDKMKIEACNCLAEIGTYDIKTLVTVSPANTKKIVNVPPRQYFANVALKACSDILFNENPSTCNKVIEALSNILKYPDGRKALDYGEINKDVLKCLSQSNSGGTLKFQVDGMKLKLYSDVDYWVPRNNEIHTQWVTRITVSLLDVLSAPSNYIGPLREVCLSKPEVCSQILPALIGLILHYSSDISGLLGRQLNKVLENICHTIEESKSDVNVLDYDQKMIVQYILDVVNFVRVQEPHYEKRKRSASACPSYNYLDLAYERVSCVARAAEQHLVAVYYGEAWATAAGGCVPPASPRHTAQLPGGERMQEIFRKCFASIGELDAVEGCGTGHLRSDAEKRRHYVSSGQYVDALQLHDVALARGPPLDLEERQDLVQCQDLVDLQYGVVTALHQAGMHYLALQYIRSSAANDDRMNDVKYDCLTYLGDWSNFVDTRELKQKLQEPTCQPNSILKAFRYACLKNCLNIRPSEDLGMRLEEPLDDAKLAVAKLSQSLNMENCQSLYHVVEYLHLFRDIDQYDSVRRGKAPIHDLVSDWHVRKLPTFNDFKHIESLITQRSVILDHASRNYESITADIVELQLQYAELGLSNERIQLAQRVLALVKDIDTSGKAPMLESQIAWARGHKDIALSLLLNVVTDPANTDELSAASMRQYGLWMAECKRENTREIINKYLEKSLEYSNTANDLLTKTKVSYDIAKFADEEYKQVVTYMKSHTFENKVKCMKNIKDVAATFRGTQGLTGDERKAYATNNAFGALEEAEISNTIAERQSFLSLAMRYYLESLIGSDDYNLSIFRVVSLWLDNSELALGDMAALLHRIPSWKFLTVLPQLAPRLTCDDTPFADNLRTIISRCAVEHPHHTLPILFNLKNSDKDPCTVTGRGSGTPGPAEARVVSAGALVTSLADREPALRPVIAQMERLCDAMITFAYLEPQKKQAKEPIPSSQPLAALRLLDAVPVPTYNVTLSRNGDYSRIVSLTSFEKYYELVGGVNCPKKISCYCSDGKKRILLIKGQDDLRQDAMMQQVFTIVNTLLEKNPVTSRNKLYIRTYKVVPLSRQSGVLEWCEGTMPLGIYLVSAHSTLRPQDISSSAARVKLVECFEKKKSNEQKLNVFLQILKKFRPIFHYFFTERYLDPVTWYERRLAYTRSVAVSSMVGYIMGLGDRHVKNILIDECTAEVVHIDFGIAFDQGKTLRTPETVPFRLTQDIIAGFGSNGVEGVFRRCCEKSLQLLRDSQETLLTILEVLLCDPLHSWVVSDKKLRENSIQCSEEVPVGGLAERALLAVRCKLCGADGVAGGAGGAGVSARGHVARLIAAATDPANLCRLYPGWQPYL